MGLTGSLMIGRSALTASQVALQMTGNNIANASTPGYHRQRIELSPTQGLYASENVFLGRGVGVDAIRRVVDPSLQARLRGSIADQSAASVERAVTDTIESLTNELTGIDLSSELSRFFNAFSELANNPTGEATRRTVIEQGASLAGYVRSLRSDLVDARTALERDLTASVARADELLDRVAQLNESIVNAELGRAEEGNLRDQRDLAVQELSELLDVTVIEQETGAVDVLVDSQPVVLGTVSRGLEVDARTESGELTFRVLTKRPSDEREEVRLSSGRVGALLEQRSLAYEQTIDELDAVVGELIFAVNQAHAAGRPAGGLTDTTGWLEVATADFGVALNDPANTTFSALTGGVRNGGFTVRLTDDNGNIAETTVFVDLDGVTAAGAAGFADDTTLNSLVADLDAVSGLNAQVTAEGRLRVWTDAGYDVSFGEDTSGALAVLGINTFFEGTDATNIAVRSELSADSSLLVVGAGEGTNETALAIAALRDGAREGLGGRSIAQAWRDSVEGNAVRASSAQSRELALTAVRDSLVAQEAAISGVSLDEESINLITYQQQYTGAAQFISVVDELTQLLLSLV